jgi:hypothetical protein
MAITKAGGSKGRYFLESHTFESVNESRTEDEGEFVESKIKEMGEVHLYHGHPLLSLLGFYLSLKIQVNAIPFSNPLCLNSVYIHLYICNKLCKLISIKENIASQ